jgi:D-alanyl-D-alanine carboxypeptidase/D-alanyl-D-alanine-endopeptidase (penicillin-binding protein 4)
MEPLLMSWQAPLPLLSAILLASAVVLTAVSEPAQSDSGGAVAQVLRLPDASLVVEEGGRLVLAYQPDRPMVPASTMKLLTALAAIDRWGLDHRFHTDFFRSSDGWLWVKGYGDPYLVSEELDLIARALKARGLKAIPGIGTDDSFFSASDEIPGRSDTNNPYDAPVTALAANFNTVSLIRVGGTVRSGEPQTPLTALARQLGASAPAGKQRINLKDRALALRYFAELLEAKLRGVGISVSGTMRDGSVPSGARLLYRHENTRSLRDILASMLKYSNNFIANDLFLDLADRRHGQPIRVQQAQRRAAAWVKRRFGWHGYRVEDGAGLSRGNRLTARQLLALVNAFTPYRHLLPEHDGMVLAKTGTLTGVSCYAGFFQRNGRWEPFSLMINQPVAYNFRLEVATDLAASPDIADLCRRGPC